MSSTTTINTYGAVPNTNNESSFELIRNNTCPSFTYTPPINAMIYRDDPNQNFGMNTLDCEYNIYTFRTVAAVQQLQAYVDTLETSQTYVGINNYNLEQAQIFLCSQLSTNCTSGEDRCSAFLDTGDLGQYCRNNLSVAASDAAKLNFCQNHDTPECGCLRRTIDPNYNAFIRNGLTIDPTCWYSPCFNESYPLRVSTEPIVPCPPADEICYDIINLYTTYYYQFTPTVGETVPCLSSSDFSITTAPKSIWKNVTSPQTAINVTYLCLGLLVLGALIIITYIAIMF